MHLRLDLHSRVPIYVQIVEQVKAMVTAGSLEPGSQLPTVREMASELRINFNTVARAYRLLHEEGVISTQQGRGTYVMEKAPPRAAEGERRARLERLIELWFEDAVKFGFSLDEIEAAFALGLSRRTAERTSL
jgi:GntR family transcriptional regulator